MPTRAKTGQGAGVRPKVSRAVAERPVVVQEYGEAQCLYCKRPFTRTRPWSKYDTNYCRMMHWHTKHRRKTRPGMITEVDGRRLAQPVPVVDEALEERVEREAEASRRWGTDRDQ